jgi:hypothetical protein
VENEGRRRMRLSSGWSSVSCPYPLWSRFAIVALSNYFSSRYFSHYIFQERERRIRWFEEEDEKQEDVWRSAFGGSGLSRDASRGRVIYIGRRNARRGRDCARARAGR